MCKIKIKEYTIKYCKQKQKIKVNVMKELEQKIQIKEQELIDSNYNNVIQAQRDSLIKEFHGHVNEKNKGAQIRSRAKWIEEGEKPTKYFFNLEKQNVYKNMIKQLKKEDGSLTQNDAEIIEEGVAFYQNLYKKDNISYDDIKDYLQEENELKTINENEKQGLEGKITKDECEIALNSMKSNKSPGSDGIPMEFYKMFWADIHLMLTYLNHAYEIGELSATQKRGILSLIFKKSDKELLKNWRPISLLNTDYKILTHELANRLKKVISKIISTDQNGYVKGRNIAYNIRLIQDVIDYFENENIEGAILFLDFQKAFDTVNHDFLIQVLETFNFGNSFIKWVKTIYCNAESCLANNGWTSKPFHIQKGIRQGCPLSALLFLLVVEILGDRIRHNKSDGLEIKIKNQSKFIQVSQLADDTTVFLKNEKAIKNCLCTINTFGKVSGLKLNIDKTEGLWLGAGKNRHDNFANINWNNESIKALGVYFGYNKTVIEEKNWKNKVETIKKILNKWHYRDLTMQGRILIIKTLALSQVVYLISSLCVPEWVINDLNKEFYSFVWKYRRDKISRKVLSNELENGGLNMIDLRAFCSASKAIWAQRLLTSETETWSIIPNKYMEKCDIKLLMNMNIGSKKIKLPIKLPNFYEDVLFSWFSCGGGSKAPQNSAEIRQQLIWGNKHIQTKGKTLFYQNWYNCNINFIDDLIDNGGNLKTGAEIFQSLKDTSRTNWLIEYNTILKSIPKAWKDKIKETNAHSKVKKELKPFIFDGYKYIYELPSKIKDYYKILIKRIVEKSYIEKHWNSVIPNKPNWNDIWRIRIREQQDKKLSEFHYKLIHKILPCQENLFKWKISNSNTCRFGCQALETYNHLFLTCPRLNKVTIKLENIFRIIGFDFKLVHKTLIFGHKIIYPAYKNLNYLISCIFFAIYKHWLYNNKNTSIDAWIQSHLILRKNICTNLHNTAGEKLFDKVLKEWQKYIQNHRF